MSREPETTRSARPQPDPPGCAETVSLSAQERIDRVCLAFENAWKSGRRPSLEAALAEVQAPDRGPLLAELLRLDLYYRARLDEHPAPEEYLARFPDDGSAVHSAFQWMSAGEGDPTVASPTPSVSTSATDDEPVLAPDARLGRYVIRRLLGRGGFALVYLAWDEELSRHVAAKVPRRGRFDEAGLKRFLDEARATAGLEHPGIVGVHDVGQSVDGTPFIIMQYVQGPSLAELLRARRPAPAEAAELLIRVAEAVHFAHRKGFIHRDLKPSNILLDAAGQPHVADFGLAVHESVQRRHAGEASGSLPYMAPEQLLGKAHRLDGRADVWALGVVLYQMLVGRRPFTGRTAGELRDEILQRDPKPPRQIDDAVPAELEQVCLRCLAKPIAERYPTAADLAANLRRWRVPRRTRGWLWPAAGATAVLVALAAWLWGWQPAGNNLPVPPAEVSLVRPTTPPQAQVDVLVWAPGDKARRGLGLRDPGALPLRAGDQIRVQAELDRPMHLYLLWIDSEGQVFPVHPWQPGHWDPAPAGPAVQQRVSLPAELDRGWPMGGGPGMETVVLLARSDPLPADLDFRTLLADVRPGPQRMQHPRALVEFDHGKVLGRVADVNRGPQFFDPQQIDDPVLRTQQLLSAKLGPHFEVIRSTSFANAGPGTEK